MNLRGAVLATMAYYDALDFALTKEEIFRFLIRFKSGTADRFLITQETVNAALNDVVREGTAGERPPDNGGAGSALYYLFGKEYLVPLRRKNEQLARQRWSTTLHITSALAYVPFIQAVFATGSLALDNTDELSDLDVIIIARHGRIWSVRLFISLLLSLFRVRRTYRDIKAPGKICPNHFITDQSLSIPFHSPYTAHLYAATVPLWATDEKLLEQFRIENEWLFHFMYYWQMPPPRMQTSILASVIRILEEWILSSPLGAVVEWFARWYQKRRIASRRVEIIPGGHLVYDDTQLAFHEGSSESAILERYNRNLASLGLLA